MTDQPPPDPQPEASGLDATVSLGQVERVTTGVVSVDRVLREVEALDELPIEEHLAVFADAHESLRTALDQAPDGDAHEAPRRTSVGSSDGQPDAPA